MSKEKALQILKTPIDELKISSDYYKAVFHLLKYPGLQTEDALLKLLKSNSEEKSVQLAKRKAVEVLARLGSQKSINEIGKCLDSKDLFLVENAAWALQKLGCKDSALHLRMIQLLDEPKYNRRALVQCLAELEVSTSIIKIKEILKGTKSPRLRGACIAAICRLCGEKSCLDEIGDQLLTSNQTDRYLAVQDVINSKDPHLLESVVKAPVALSFRMRAVEEICNSVEDNSRKIDPIKILDQLIMDHPSNIILLHSYDFAPSIEFLVNELFEIDCSRSYLALSNLIKESPNKLWPVISSFWEEFKSDYSAVYFLTILFRYVQGWNHSQIKEIEDLIIFLLSDSWPEHMKFRPAAVVTLMKINSNLGMKNIPRLLDPKVCLFWPTRYSALMSIDFFLPIIHYPDVRDLIRSSQDDPNKFIRCRAGLILDKYN